MRNPLADIYADWVLTHVFSSITRETGVHKLVVTTCQKVAMLTYWILPNWHFLTTLTEVFFLLFSSVVRRMPVYNAKTGHGSHSSQARWLHQCVCPQSHAFSWDFGSLGSKPSHPSNQRVPFPNKVSHVLPYHKSLVCPSVGLQPRLKIGSLKQNPQLQYKVSVTEPSDAIKRMYI